MSLAEPMESSVWESPEWQEAVRQNPGLKPFFDNLESFVELPGGVEKLRELVLDLAVRGNLSEQTNGDEPAAELLARTSEKRKRLEKAKEIRKQKYPPPPVGDEIPHPLPSGWEWTRLSIIGEIGPRNDLVDDLEVSFLPMKTIADGFTSSIQPESRPWGEIKKGFTHVADGDIALAKITPCFQNRKSAVMRGLLNGVGAGTTELHVVRPIPDSVVPEYALLHLKCLTFLEIGVSKMTGSAGQKRVPKEYFADTPFPLPPLAEQRRIVSKVEGLMSLCDTLESHRRARESVRERASRSVLASLTSAPRTASTPQRPKAAPKRQASGVETLASAWQRLSDHFEVLLDQPSGPAHLRQSILQLAVQGKLVPQDPSDESGHEVLESALRQKQVELEEMNKKKKKTSYFKKPEIDPPHSLPDSWAWTDLDAICHFTNGKAHEQLVDDSGPFVLINSRFVSTNGAKKKYASEVLTPLRVNDLAIVMSDVPNGRALARCFQIDKNDFYTLNQRVGSLRIVSSIDPDFASLVLDRNEHFLSFNDGKKQTNLRKGQILACPFPVPPKAEQKWIVSKVSVLLSQLDELSARWRSRQSTTDALLTALIHRILDGTA